MQTYTAEVKPVTGSREFRQENSKEFTFQARNGECANAKALFRAENLSRTTGIEYGVVRVGS